eukprot:gene19434-biopygen16048
MAALRATHEEEEWLREAIRSDSAVSRHFFGSQKHSITCDICGHVSATQQVLRMMSIPIPAESGIAFADLVQQALQGEQVDWSCPVCEKKVSTSYKRQPIQLPHYWILFPEIWTPDGTRNFPGPHGEGFSKNKTPIDLTELLTDQGIDLSNLAPSGDGR